MIALTKNSAKAKLFFWCVHHPFARSSFKDSDGKEKQRPPEWYMENGTTLCHFFWTCLWLPLLTIAVGSFPFIVLVEVHIDAYHRYGTTGLFVPSGFILGIVSITAVIILSIVGAGKVGLLAYLAALKQHICPRITFRDERPEITS